MSEELKPCPFCGSDPEQDHMDRLIVFHCRQCGYSRAFSGILQAAKSPVPVGATEFYHADAKEKAIAAWNHRADAGQVKLTEPAERDAFEAAWRAEYPLHEESVFIRSRLDPAGYAGTRINDGWKMWQARAILSRAPVAAQASEPVAWLLENKRIGFWKAYATHAQAEDVLRHHKDVGCFDTAMTPMYSDIPQPSAEAVRDAALEEAANTATAFLVGDPLAGIPLRNPMTHEIAAAIRALKSAPPQPAEQPAETPLLGHWRSNNGIVCCGSLRIFSEDFDTTPSDQFKNEILNWVCDTLNAAQKPVASPAALTEEQLQAIERVEYFLKAWEWNGVGQSVAQVSDSPDSYVGLILSDLRTTLALARVQGEQA